MACTVFAKRTAELKLRITKKDQSFQTIYLAFDQLLGARRGRHSLIWSRKQLVRLRDLFPDPDSQKLLDKLDERVHRAEEKRRKRDEARAAAKAANVAKRSRKTNQPTTTPAPAPGPDVWSL